MRIARILGILLQKRSCCLFLQILTYPVLLLQGQVHLIAVDIHPTKLFYLTRECYISLLNTILRKCSRHHMALWYT